MEKDVDISDKEIKIINDDLKGTDWFISPDGTVFIDYIYDMKNWENDKKIIMKLKGGG
ncbi:hypothetical protein SOV_22400 [Sporomusa ovata DSM 2662]|uniref:Uncharacterized protein n=1 Tax=Sporomusa ovata TaxID=2378 RepID=A0A0U1L373_9FIRM|nr:hypothetical protein [Sporomusa ovata]EQB25556.1 hypothetical protein SOV_4c02190 [Sporomusa ovata DSM 2662]CQR74118.1 hypothetical protein SpAn4DRAFT_0580 [Sporomusa ovata]